MEKKRKMSVVGELLDHSAKGSNDRHRGAPLKEPLENDAKPCYCHCPQHPSPKPEVKTMPCGHTMGGRNLIVCIDGTANQFGEKNTNVIEIYNLVMKEFEDNQFTWYNSGIGTYARPHWRSAKYMKQIFFHKVDLAIAWHFDKTILGAYRWLSDNYQKGDCIFLFGFSRGAFQVRTLSGMIHKVGLIHKGNEMQIPFAYELYADPTSDEKVAPPVGSTSNPEPISMAERFKKAFSHEGVKVHFVGAWYNAGMDRSRPPSRWMVSEAEALGLRLRPFERELLPNEQIEFRESLKGPWHLFELLPFRRLTFARSPGAKSNTFLPHLWASRKIHAGQKIHSSLILADTPYIPKARPPPPRANEPTNEDNAREYDGGDDADSDLSPEFSENHAGSGSAESGVERGSDQGGSLRRLLHQVYPARTTRAPGIRDTAFWDQLRKDGLANSEGWLEIDLVEYARLLLKRLVDSREVDGAQRALEEIVTKYPKGGAQAVYDGTIETIQLWKKKPPELGAQDRVLRAAIEILQGNLESLKLRMWGEIWNALADIRRSGTGDHQDVAKRFLDCFSVDANCFFKLRDHKNWVLTVAVSPDSKRIVSGSSDNTIRIWDLATGAQVGEPLRGHTGWVWSIAISRDGSRIVSGSMDETIRIWDAATGAQAGEPLRGHEHFVISVAISPDGKRVVSGSADNTIRIWDLETGAQVGEPLRGHTDSVYSVAISPDGKHIVSGSEDSTIRVWDAETGAQEGEPLRGHTDTVHSVAILPDGKRIVSGSHDETIRVWDAETGAQVGEPLRGHTGDVNCVAISPDVKHLVSGSDDRTIRIWDLHTRAQVGEPLRGHTEWVTSVAISPDGKRIVSGGWDKIIRIWSAEGMLV
ncbi:hypothetical protein EST38_g9336 [Candolleomyces aberdarensis]|uniref:T6SS Phospholipase effector Tle1-like catalytic domain-containing protein n=1 Tax=Candolleomyces aberdarensis TaxID=2316362 RepID=A0A4Q2DA65_9AGAR|nr:hypothetical protein EST38_g9336 [Candolleomyces aberdarensis]